MARNHHATVVVLDDRGVLIEGPSGSGKSALGRHLVARWRAAGRFAILVGDDQVFVDAANGRILARAPSTIAGRMEVRGLGIVTSDHEPAAVLDLAVLLRPEAGAPRLAGGQRVELAGLALPQLHLAGGRPGEAADAVEHALSNGAVDV